MSASFTIKTETVVSDEKLLELLEHGADYGSTYWSPSYACAWPDAADIKSLVLEMSPCEEDSEHLNTITYARAKQAMQILADKHPDIFNRITNDYDAGDCDCLVQIAAYGAIIFG